MQQPQAKAEAAAAQLPTAGFSSMLPGAVGSCRGSRVSLSVPRDGVRIAFRSGDAFRTGLAGHRNIGPG